jgi:hypothetical protein
MILVLHYYKSTIDGVMTSLIDTYFNLRRSLAGKNEVKIKFICPELYLLDKSDYYNFSLDEDIQWYEYKNSTGLEVHSYKKVEDSIKYQYRLFKNEITTSVPFLRFNRNFGDFNFFYDIVQDQNKFECETVICSARLLYEILMGVDIEIKCNNLLVLDSLDTYKSKIGLFPNFDDLFDTMFKDTWVIQYSNPINFRDTKYQQVSYLHKFSYRRLSALKQSGLLKDELNFTRKRGDKGELFPEKYFENIGKQLFEHLYFGKKCNYYAEGLFTIDGMCHYLERFGIDGTVDHTPLILTRGHIKDQMFMKNTDEIYQFIRNRKI